MPNIALASRLYVKANGTVINSKQKRHRAVAPASVDCGIGWCIGGCCIGVAMPSIGIAGGLCVCSRTAVVNC